MIRLGVLGDLTLQRSSGAALSRALAQPKRMALLVYLAMRPGEFHRRDTLLGLFWPELDEKHARAALNQGLLFLRRELGASRQQVLISRGNDEVAVDASQIWCDAVEFAAHERSGRFADALALYRGDFLHGFHSGCSHEFEEWIDERRQSMRQQAAEAAARASSAAEDADDLSAAIAFARQACALANDERSTRRLIVLLDLIGDRAAALETYGQLARRLIEEFGVTPAPETTSLIERVQQRAIVTPVGSSAIADHAARSDPARVPRYRKNARRIVASVATVTLVGMLVLALRAKSGAMSMAVVPPPASPPSKSHQPSSAAHEAFLKGHYEFARWPKAGASEAALRYYTEAITKDPQYALAYAEIAELVLGTMSVTPQDVQTGEVAASRAHDLDPHLPDTHVALGLARFKSWQWRAAEREFREAIRIDSNLAAAHRFYSQLLRIERRFDEAIREARTAESLEPLSLPAKADVGSAFFVASRFDEAIQTWQGVLELDPTYLLAVYTLGLAYGIEGRNAELHTMAERASELAAGTEYELNATFLHAIESVEQGRRQQADSIVTLMQTKFPGAARLPSLVAIVMLREQRPDDAIAWLERGYRQRDFAIANATAEPWFDPLRSDARFRLLRARMGFTQ